MCSLYIDHAESLVARGGLYVNSVRMEGATEKVCPDRHLLGGAITILRIGKYVYLLHYGIFMILTLFF